MIDLTRETPVTLANAPQLIPAINAVPGMATRKTVHERTIYNWATRGKRGVILETMPIGGILVTTRESLQRFFTQLAVARQQRFFEQEQLRGGGKRTSQRCSPKEYAAIRERLAREHGI
jgi:hypothetical protein